VGWAEEEGGKAKKNLNWIAIPDVSSGGTGGTRKNLRAEANQKGKGGDWNSHERV